MDDSGVLILLIVMFSVVLGLFLGSILSHAGKTDQTPRIVQTVNSTASEPTVLVYSNGDRCYVTQNSISCVKN